MSCYFQGCTRPGKTKEHIPPKSFFPRNQRDQLLTVKSCELHNNAKSHDDMYVLAHICMNASPSNRSREVFMQTVVPQLGYNSDALKRTLSADAISLPFGAVGYKVDSARFDRFFDALSCGIIYRVSGRSLPVAYTPHHLYHDLEVESEAPEQTARREAVLDFCKGEPRDLLNFGRVKAQNASVYTCKIFGLPEFKSSITINHIFFGAFQVSSLLTKTP